MEQSLLRDWKRRLQPYLVEIPGVTAIGLSNTGIEVRTSQDSADIRDKIEAVFEKYADTIPYRVVFSGTTKKQ